MRRLPVLLDAILCRNRSTAIRVAAAGFSVAR
jgi:hypothetical protein